MSDDIAKPTLAFGDLPEDDRAEAEKVFNVLSSQMSAFIRDRVDQMNAALSVKVATEANAVAARVQADLNQMISDIETQTNYINEAWGKISVGGMSNDELKKTTAQLADSLQTLSAAVAKHREDLKSFGKQVGQIAVTSLSALKL